jgi:pimeloyl-ACP methyl ester carboxylesterase
MEGETIAGGRAAVPVETLRLPVAGGIEAAWWGGRREGPVLVLLHEGLGSVGLWRGFPAALAAASGLPVFAYSRPGYGRSATIRLPRSLSYMEEEARWGLPAVLEAARITAPLLLGHSDGASIAALHAALAPHPGLMGLILIAPHFFVEEVSLESIAAAREAYEKGDLRARLARHHDDVDAAFWGWNRAWLDPRFPEVFDFRRLLHRIDTPSLLIQGLADEYGTVRQIEEAAQRWGRPPRTLLLEGARHSPHLTHEGEVLGAIGDFLAENGLAPPYRGAGGTG